MEQLLPEIFGGFSLLLPIELRHAGLQRSRQHRVLVFVVVAGKRVGLVGSGGLEKESADVYRQSSHGSSRVRVLDEGTLPGFFLFFRLKSTKKFGATEVPERP